MYFIVSPLQNHSKHFYTVHRRRPKSPKLAFVVSSWFMLILKLVNHKWPNIDKNKYTLLEAKKLIAKPVIFISFFLCF